MNLRNTLVTTLIAAACGAVFAQAPAPATAASGVNMPRVDRREANQERRIEQGQASGELTRREARRLNREQARIQHAEKHAQADGTVTPAERKHLARMQNQASRDIHHQKHDAQKKLPPSGPGTGPDAAPGGK